MLIDATSHVYRERFNSDPHPFISDGFIEINKHKADQIVRLIEENGSNTIGLVGGIINNTLKSPFSAPFGGFHFNINELFMEEVSKFMTHLKEYIVERNLDKVEITLPPDIYHHSVNTRFVNLFIRNGFNMATPEITNWVDLTLFDGTFTKKEARRNYKKAIRNKLTLQNVTDEKMKSDAFEIITENRKLFGRPIYMTFEDLIEINKIFPVDYFLVRDINNINVGSAIFYRGHTKIVQGTFWADTEFGRPLRTMDFLALNLYSL
jgi:hypothetical protein